MTLYVYLTQNDLVRGLDTFSNYSSQDFGTSSTGSAMFKYGGSPSPIDYVLHVSPSLNLHGMIHEYTHQVYMDLFFRDRSSSIAWIREGLAEYMAFSVLQKTKYKDDELAYWQGQLATARKGLNEGKLFTLQDMAPETKWTERFQIPELNQLQYQEAYAAVMYTIKKYGMDKCLSIVRNRLNGDSYDIAVQKALNIPNSQFEGDFKIWLQLPK